MYGQSIYYYYPKEQTYVKSFDSFHDDCNKALRSGRLQTDSGNSATTRTERFKWLQKYRRDDQSVIDRNIADGTITLQRRESKFREELERHECEYIIYKDFT